MAGVRSGTSLSVTGVEGGENSDRLKYVTRDKVSQALRHRPGIWSGAPKQRLRAERSEPLSGGGDEVFEVGTKHLQVVGRRLRDRHVSNRSHGPRRPDP